jgi:ATP-dependent Zn protease
MFQTCLNSSLAHLGKAKGFDSLQLQRETNAILVALVLLWFPTIAIILVFQFFNRRQRKREAKARAKATAASRDDDSENGSVTTTV